MKTSPITPEKKQKIITLLQGIEKKHGIEILFACESGSRAWGFHSPDSDYDIRFIYVHNAAAYLSLKPPVQVIEHTVPAEEFDVAGWDLHKALGLILKGNAVVSEWLQSPVVYANAAVFTEELTKLVRMSYARGSTVGHHLSLIKNTMKIHFSNLESVKFKKYFYVLRSIFSIDFILDSAVRPPMAFDELFSHYADKHGSKDLDVYIEISHLLHLKAKSSEVEPLVRSGTLDAFINRKLSEFAEFQNGDAVNLPSVNWSIGTVDGPLVEQKMNRFLYETVMKLSRDEPVLSLGYNQRALALANQEDSPQ